MKRVLILIPTNNVKAYCIGKFITNLRSMNLEEADILFSDDTYGDEEHKKILERLGFEVIKVTKTIDALKRGEKVPIVEALANARNALRAEFVKREQYTHAMWIDSDILPPYDAVTRLLQWDQDIVSGIYFQKRERMAGNSKYEMLEPMIFRYKERENVNLGINEYGDEMTVQDLFPNRLIGGRESDIPLIALGTGCFMASRRLMADDRWTFRFNPDRISTTEDMWFSMDIVNLGYEIYADSGVCCKHYMNAWVGQHR